MAVKDTENQTYDLPHFTAETFEAYLALPEKHDRRFELIEGVIVEMSAASMFTSIIAGKLFRYIDEYLDHHPIGFATVTDGSYKLDHHQVLIPDVGFIRIARQTEVINCMIPMPPDLAVEIISPSDTVATMQRKAQRYLESGTQAVWIVEPIARTVTVYRLQPSVEKDTNLIMTETLTITDQLSGDNFLPNFLLPIYKLFQFSTIKDQ